MTDIFPPKRDAIISADGVIVTDHAKFLEDLTENANLLQAIDGDPIGNLITKRKMLGIRQDGGAGTTLYVNEVGDGTANGWRAL